MLVRSVRNRSVLAQHANILVGAVDKPLQGSVRCEDMFESALESMEFGADLTGDVKPISMIDHMSKLQDLKRFDAGNDMVSDEVCAHVNVLMKHAASMSLNDIITCMKLFAELGLRMPTRDLGPVMFPFLRVPGNESKIIEHVCDALTVMGRGMIYHAELFEYCVKHAHLLSPRCASVFFYECGRHGLRCKHFAKLPERPEIQVGREARFSDAICECV